MFRAIAPEIIPLVNFIRPKLRGHEFRVAGYQIPELNKIIAGYERPENYQVPQRVSA